MRKSRRVMSEINVVPLVDVMLVLLIIFMITAPMIHQGIDVDLPQARGKEIPAEERVAIAIMGGSFIEHGGQNPLEPAYWGKAIICGPHMENFPFINEFYRSGGALKVDADKLYESLKNLLDSPEKISSMGNIAKELYEKNSGATDRAMKEIERYL